MGKDRLVLGTRKGLIVLQQNGRKWESVHSIYPGVPFFLCNGRSAHKFIVGLRRSWALGTKTISFP